MGAKRCGNCGERPAVEEVNGVGLCVDCAARLAAARRAEIQNFLDVQDQLGRDLNMITGMIEQSVGIRGIGPRYEPRPPQPLVTGPVSQNISIHDNAIGVLNTGTIHNLDVAVGTLRQGGAEELADTLKEFVEAAASAEGISDEDRRELLEGIELVLQEVGAAPERQRRGLVRMTIARITEIAAAVTVVSEAWQRLEPLLRKAFDSAI